MTESHFSAEAQRFVPKSSETIKIIPIQRLQMSKSMTNTHICNCKN